VKYHHTSNKEALRNLFTVAESQGGYFTAADALAVGYSYPQQSYHKARGHWQAFGWGLYRLRNYPHTDDEDLVRLSLWSRNKKGVPQAVVSYDTALRLYELSDVLPNAIHLTVPKTFRKAAPEAVVLHKAALEPQDSRAQGPFRVTTPLRTLLDVADSNLSPEHLERAVTEALERGLVRRKALLGAVSQLPLGANSRERLEQALQAKL
jgi:predicted transcriptional regulator of viral defense system